MDDEAPDLLGLLDAVKEWAEGLRGMIAVLAADGWTEDQARRLVLHLVTKQDDEAAG